MVIGESAMKFKFFPIFAVSLFMLIVGAHAVDLKVCLANPVNVKLCEVSSGLKICLKSQSVCSYTKVANSDATNIETQLQWLTTETSLSKKMQEFHGHAL